MVHKDHREGDCFRLLAVVDVRFGAGVELNRPSIWTYLAVRAQDRARRKLEDIREVGKVGRVVR